MTDAELQMLKDSSLVKLLEKAARALAEEGAP